jgi:hypothetical protein
MRSSASNQTHQQKQKTYGNSFAPRSGILECWNNGKTPFSRGDISGHILRIERPFRKAEHSSSSASGNSLAYPSPRHSMLPSFQSSILPIFQILFSHPSILPGFILSRFHHSIFPLFQYSRFSSSILHAQIKGRSLFQAMALCGR